MIGAIVALTGVLLIWVGITGKGPNMWQAIFNAVFVPLGYNGPPVLGPLGGQTDQSKAPSGGTVGGPGQPSGSPGNPSGPVLPGPLMPHG